MPFWWSRNIFAIAVILIKVLWVRSKRISFKLDWKGWGGGWFFSGTKIYFKESKGGFFPLFSRSVVSDSLQPRGLQHGRLLCPVPVSQSLLKLTSIELMMPSSYLVLCIPLLLLPSIFPSISDVVFCLFVCFWFFCLLVCFRWYRRLKSRTGKPLGDFPGSPVVKSLTFSAGMEVQSLVGALRSHMPCCSK